MTKNERRYPEADPALSYDLAKNELSIFLSTVDALDNKIGLGVSLATTLIAILLAFLGLRTTDGAADAMSNWSIGLAATTGFFYLCNMASFGISFWMSSWSIGLSAKDAWREAETYEFYPRDLYWWATEMFLESISNNRLRYRRKQYLTTAGFVLLAAEFVFGVASIAVTLR